MIYLPTKEKRGRKGRLEREKVWEIKDRKKGRECE